MINNLNVFNNKCGFFIDENRKIENFWWLFIIYDNGVLCNCLKKY